MPTFDIVSEVDMQEVRNAVDQANRELGTRFDFRGVTASFELEEDAILIRAQEEFQIEQMEDILRDKLVRRKVDTGCLDPRRESKRPARETTPLSNRAGHRSRPGQGNREVRQGIEAQGPGRRSKVRRSVSPARSATISSR